MIAVIGLIIGIVLGVLLDPTVPAWLTPFLPVAVVAGLDALLAGRTLRRPRVRDLVLLERRRCLSPGLPGNPAGRRIGHDDSRRRRARYSYFFQHCLDPSTAPEGLT